MNFIKFLWLYNQTDIFYDIECSRYFRKGIKKYSVLKNKSRYNEEKFNIKSWILVEEASRFALREAGVVFLHFKDWNIIGMINDFSIFLSCKSNENIDRIMELAKECGLFIRKCKYDLL